MNFKIQIGDKYSITQYVVFSLIIGVVIACLSGPLNGFLKRYGRELNPIICNSVWFLKNENLQRLFYQMCILTKKEQLNNDDIYGFIDGVQKAIKNPYNDMFAQDERIREQRVHYSTGYAIDSYINKFDVKPFVRVDKPKGYFEDVYQPNKYNEEQKILLEQAQYTEFPSTYSSLGPARELKYVGLHFPYGLNLEKTTENN